AQAYGAMKDQESLEQLSTTAAELLTDEVGRTSVALQVALEWASLGQSEKLTRIVDDVMTSLPDEHGESLKALTWGYSGEIWQRAGNQARARDCAARSLA